MRRKDDGDLFSIVLVGLMIMAAGIVLPVFGIKNLQSRNGDTQLKGLFQLMGGIILDIILIWAAVASGGRQDGLFGKKIKTTGLFKRYDKGKKIYNSI